MKTVSTIALLSFLVAGSAAQAAEATAAQRAACTPDVMSLCSSEIPNVSAIKVCLRREKARLSAGCRAVIDIADKGMQTASVK